MNRHSKRGSFIRIVIPFLLALFYFSLLPDAARRAPWYEELLLNALMPFQWAFNYLSDPVKGLWNNYINLVNVNEKNELLRAENVKLKEELYSLDGLKRENERLTQLLKFKELSKISTLVASVIVNDPRSDFKSIIVDRGADDGVGLLMPVMGPSGLVGRVEKVFSGKALVLLLTDPNSAVDVQVQRSGTRAILVGVVKHPELRPVQYLTNLEYLEERSDVENGDLIVTSGFDGIFPPDLPIGRVNKIVKITSSIFKSAEILPFEEFGQLKEVVILLTDQTKDLER